MGKLMCGATTASALAVTVLLSGQTNAMAMGAPDGYRAAVADLNMVENAQFIFGGRRHCWYDRGWHGPGWYWCGYAFRRGLGWGGPEGWQGWRREERRERREERREHREHR